MRKICIANQKGGVGKTTTALCIADALIHSNYKVLFLDLDPQCNSTTSYKAMIDDFETIYDVMNGKCGLLDAVQHTEFGDIVAGDPLLVEDENKFLTKIGGYNIIKNVLKNAETEDYDFCIMDTPPNLGIYMYNALTAADEVLIPIKAEKFAIDGLTKLLSTIREIIDNTNPELKISGVLLTCYDRRNKMDNDTWLTLPEIGEKMDFYIFKNPVRICQAVKQCQALEMSLYEYAGDSNAAEDYINITKQLLNNN